MEQVLYIISILYIFITFILYKKSEEKISILKFFSVSIICLLCYNTLLCFLLNTLNIPIKLIILSVINLIFGSIILGFVIKSKEIQKYTFKLRNIVAVIIILFTTLFLSYCNFGKELNIKYIMTDAAVHFSAAREFYENDTLTDKIENDVVTNNFMPGAYTNTGILFKVFEPFIGYMDLYKVFIFFDIFLLFMVGILMYTAIEKLINTYIKFVISMVMIIIFMLGYPLNSFIYGFVYLQLGIALIACIINLLQYYIEKFDKKILYGLLFLCNFGIFFTYCIFMPIIFVVEFIYIFKKRYSEIKKIFTLKNFLIFVVTFLIPIILGSLYFILPYFNTVKTEEAFVNIEGYIYRNCWANFIFILPMTLICFRKKHKNDDTFVLLVFISVLIISMVGFFIAINKLNLSTYYYYKFNFILWFVLWYGAIYGLNIESKKVGYFITSYFLTYAVLAVIVTHFNKVEITKELFDDDENITNTFDIYGINKTVIKDVMIDYDQEELKLLDYVYNNINLKEDNILLLANARQEYWFDGFFNYKNRSNLESFIPQSEVDKWNNKEYKYLIIFYRSRYYNIYKDIIKYGNLLIENEEGAIYINN